MLVLPMMQVPPLRPDPAQNAGAAPVSLAPTASQGSFKPLPSASPADTTKAVRKTPETVQNGAADVFTAEPLPQSPRPTGIATPKPAPLLRLKSVGATDAVIADAPSPAEGQTAQAFGTAGDVATQPQPSATTEAYANAPQDPVHVTTEEPVSTFSTDIDTAAYSLVLPR